MNISTRVHTIFMLVGPSECGKTTFARQVLIPQLRKEDASRNLRTNVQYLSSDAIRQELLGHDYDKYDQSMLEVSHHAFGSLFERLRAVTSFPILSEFVIVDSTGLAEDFRSKVREIAGENNYNVEVILFDYRKREDYYASERSKKLITNHLNRLKKEVLPVLSREDYEQVHRIRAKDFLDAETGRMNKAYEVDVADWELFASCVLPTDRDYIVVGDVHECVQELQGLLRGHGFQIEEGRMKPGSKLRKRTEVVLVGDWIDKGKQTEAIVAFLHDNREHFRLTLGNHENFVHKYVKGEINGADSELLEHYFDSVGVLAGNEELFRRFEELVLSSRPFYRYNGVHSPSFYVTHAPCRNKYIGKLDRDSLRNQRSFRINREADIEEQLSYLQVESAGNQPYHIFGHVAAKQSFRLKNKIHIDSGCAHGNMLTSVMIAGKPFFKSIKMEREAKVTEELPTLFHQEHRVSLQELDDESLRRLAYSAVNGVNFISGTMPPADKDLEAGELESLRKGLSLFAERGVGKVVLQPKYMGSRCTVYLNRDSTLSYAVSRNGYKIKAVDLTRVYSELLGKFGDYMIADGVSVMVLDGELLPWKALGDGLLEKQFKPIEKALETEIAFLRDNGFDEALGRLWSEYDDSGFEQEQSRMQKGALSEKYGASVYQTYKHVRDSRSVHRPIAEHAAAFEVYRKQLELYGGDAEIAFKPFGILKEVLLDGEERRPAGPTSDMYRFLSDDECLVLDLEKESAYEQAEVFFERLTTEEHMEGVVIKPEHPEDSPIPYMKVRNGEYLSIIYGYDYRFPHKYAKLLKGKNVSSKLRTAISEYKLGNEMLDIKLSDIDPGNVRFRDIAANLLFEVAKEKEMDPRL
ncbi:metallophosphoesterase [Paenibacillus agaridevorans]|uniref:Metallophosphoesterase n=1 Tax=Paenibacillus agaridevorans TaxID=171404 RepID=A0A2R5ERF1_9BACL|nr:AAA family ATPase [Paenibacillus agaridevorans]GBG09260.1 metallophosphoesterase [Paenibacillus agaridevorans]